MSINISANELHIEQFPKKLIKLLKKNKLNPKNIELEITETSLVCNDQMLQKIIHEISDTGVGLALDDFGTGFTAFNQLAHYPVNTLKIDRSFVTGLGKAGKSEKSMIDIFLSLAELYGLVVVAEGVETESELDYLSNTHCQYFQGYYLSKPLKSEQIEELLFNKS